MVVVFHGEEGGWGAAQKGQEDEGSFGDSPFVLAGFGFISGVGKVGDDVDQQQVCQEYYFNHFCSPPDGFLCKG